MRYSIIPWNEREKLISTIPSTTLRTSYFRTFVLFLFLPFFVFWQFLPLTCITRWCLVYGCSRSELWGILSIGATSGLTMPHRCDNHPLSTWPSCRHSKNNTALFTVVRLSVLSEWLWEMNISIRFVSNFCIIKNIFLGKDSWSCNSYVFPRLYTMFNLLIDNWKIDIAIKREKIQLSLVTLCWF